jgi:hypothetical protein
VEGALWRIITQNANTRSFLNWRNPEENPLKKCRMCNIYDETLEHILTNCLGNNMLDVVPRHNRVVLTLLQELLNKYQFNIQLAHSVEPSYLKHDVVRITYDLKIYTEGQRISNNKPDIVVFDFIKKHIWIIDVSVPFDKNVQMREDEKLQKYLPLKSELLKNYANFTASIVPIIIGTLGVTTSKYCDYLFSLELPNEKLMINKLTKKALIGTALTLTNWETKMKGIL